MSQGALTSLACLLRYNGTTPLGGVVIESGTMVLNLNNRLTNPEEVEVQGSTPIFIYHGTADTVIPWNLSEPTYDYLKNVVYKDHMENFTLMTEEGMGHVISDKEERLVKEWLHNKMGKPIE